MCRSPRSSRVTAPDRAGARRIAAAHRFPARTIVSARRLMIARRHGQDRNPGLGRLPVRRGALSCDGGARHVAYLPLPHVPERSEEHTSELQSLMRISYAVFCLKTKTIKQAT